MTEPLSVALRLKAIRENAGVGLRQIARRLNISPSSYSHYEDPKRFKAPFLPLATAREIASALEPEGVAKYVLELAGSGPQTSALEPVRVEYGDVAPPDTDLVAVFDISASAGHGALVGDYEAIAYTLAFPPDYLQRVTRANPRDLAIISVKGDSMEPTLRDDDIVMIDISKTNLSYEGLFVVRFDDALHVKRIARSRPGFVHIISDNTRHYPTKEYAVENVVAVGKVLWKGGNI